MPISRRRQSRSGLRRALPVFPLALCALLCGQGLAGERQPAAASPYRLAAPPGEFLLRPDLDRYRLAPARRMRVAPFSDMPYASEVDAAARDADLDPALLHALIHVESRHRAQAVSPKGAIGLMQVLPETAARFGVAHPERSVEANLKAGSLYLQSLMRQFDGRLDLSLAAYNAGEGAVLRHAMAIPPYPETRRYVPAVIEKYEEWRAMPNAVVRIDYLPGTRLVPQR